MNIKENLESLSDKELLQLINEIKLTVIPENALVRKILLDSFGEINILVLQIQQLLWPLLEIISERLNAYI